MDSEEPKKRLNFSCSAFLLCKAIHVVYAELTLRSRSDHTELHVVVSVYLHKNQYLSPVAATYFSFPSGIGLAALAWRTRPRTVNTVDNSLHK
jgi:hypothetical protein